MERNCAVIYDASVLFPSSVRNLLVELGVYAIRADLFRPKWTEQINDEWARNVKLRYPDVSMAGLERTRSFMNKATRECIVTDYEDLIEQIELPEDPRDRHVVAAGIKSSAKIIVTNNLAHFPDHRLQKHGLKALTADDFLILLMDEHEDGEKLILDAVRAIQSRLKQPPMTMDEYLSKLENPDGPNLVKTGTRLRLQLIPDLTTIAVAELE
jgi:hypothetical protein